MQRNILLLVGLLAAQVLLAGGLLLSEPDLSASRPDAELLDIDTATVDRIRIEDSDSEVVLERENDTWVLPDVAGGFPASQMNVSRLLDSLAGLQRGFAVATSDAARSRLNVAEDAFERRLTFYAGDSALATLYLGSSAGANQVHARTAADDAVYLVDFGAFNAPASSADWQDKTTLRIPRDEIRSIGVGGLTLTRMSAASSDAAVSEGSGPNAPEPGGEASASESEPDATADSSWTLAGGPEGASLRQGSADSLAIQLGQLTTGAVLGTEAADGYGLDEPALSLEVVTSDDERIELTLASRAEADSYVLKSSARPEYFEYRTARGDQLVNAASREQLLELPGDASGSADTGNGATTPAGPRDGSAAESGPGAAAGESAPSAD